MDIGMNEGTFELNCQDTPPLLGYYDGFDAGSWETHRQVCEVRLDLDENDDQGRVGPHYRSIATCVTLFPIADNDVNIWTIDDRSIDSLVVYIKDFGPGPLEQYLRFDANPNFTVASVNDTLLRVYPALDGLTYNEWGSFIKSVRLEVPEPQTEGIRTVETWLYAGGLRADAARSYVNVRPDLPTAGPDRPYYACRAAVVRKKDIIGDASPGGRFEPELYARNLPFPPGAMDTIFQSDLIPYGTYRYIVEREGCRSDTALIDIQPPAELIAANPERNDTAFLCAGSSYNWAPGAIPTVIAGFYTDIGTTTDEPRTLTQPGTYTAYVDYFWPDNLILSGCGDIITLTLLPTPDSSLTNSLDTVLCAGQSLLYGGTVFSEAGSYNFTVDGEGCPVDYSLQIAYTDGPAVASDTTICAGESVSFGDTVYAATGSYSYTATAAQGCDTTYTLNLTVSPPDLIVVDTTICGSNSFELAGNVFTATGSYTFSNPALGTCGTTYQLDLTLLDGPDSVSLDTTVCEGEVITFFGTNYSQFGTYNITIDQMGCPTDYQLTITERAPVQVELDTTLCAGETLLYAGVPFTSAGVYNVNRTIGLGCDSIFTIYLSYRPANLTVLDTAILEGETLSVADTILATPGTYLFTGTAANGCDSTLRVVLDVISSTGNPLARAAGYRVTNPIRSLREFRVFTAAGAQIGVSETGGLYHRRK